MNVGPRACVGCGCTDDRACPGGCSWASLDPPLCSTCADGDFDYDDVADGLGAMPAADPALCPASPLPAPHQPLWLDKTSGYCARCREPLVCQEVA